MAEAVARRELETLGWRHVEVESAGVAAVDGMPASAGAVRAARARGLDLSGHRTRRLTATEVEEADLVLAMSSGHLRRVAELGGRGRAHLLADFAHGEEGAGGEVPDPFGGDDAVYEETLEVLEDLVATSLRRLEPILAP